MGWLADLLGVGAQTALGYGNLAYQKQRDSGLTGAEREANAFSAQQAEIARDWQEKFYNQYESPQAMIRQAQEAGINPAAIFGNAMGGSAPSASAPSSVAPKGGDVGGAVAHLAALSKQIAEIDLVKAQTKLAGGQYDKTLSDIGVNAKTIERMDAEISNLSKNTEYLGEMIKKTGVEMSVLDAQKSLIAMQETLASNQAELFNQQQLYETWRNNMIKETGIDPETLTPQWRFAMSVLESLVPDAKTKFENFMDGIKLKSPFKKD